MSPIRAFVLFSCLALACGKSAPPAHPPGVTASVALSAVSSCQQLDASVQNTAARQMRSQLDLYKKGSMYPVAFGGGPTANPNTSDQAPASYTTTNTQVSGVDEADFVKNDGTRIFVLSGDSLYSAKSWPPSDLSLASRLQIEGWPQSMFLAGDRVVVFSLLWSQASGGGMCPMVGDGAMPACWGGSSTAKVTIVDVTNLPAPKIVEERYFPGYLSSARRVGSAVRLVLSDNVRWPDGVKWWPDWDPAFNHNHDLYVAAIDALEDANEAIIRKTPAQQWFPNGKRKLNDGTVVDVSYQCSDFYLSNAPERLGLLTVASIDLTDLGAPPSRASIVGEAGVVYATAQNLYIASEHWWWWDEPGQVTHTYLHLFDISDPKRAVYLASGGLDGRVHDQFSMDESNGYLRVAASTALRMAGDATNPWRLKTGTHVAVLARDNDKLTVVGDTGELMPDESLRGARFLGSRGFVDTFRGYDPLITIDLSEPSHPRKVAALTVEGFSTYLQPIDDGHLLAMGTDVPPPDPVTGHVDWSRRALQISLFDVSDLSHPTRTANQLVGTMAAWSEAVYDHHAFNWYGERDLLAIPLSDWQYSGRNWYDNFISEARIFKVDAAAGKIAPVGALGLADVYVTLGDGQWSYRYSPWVRRSVMATDSNQTDYVYAVTDAGVRVAALNDLAHPIATMIFPRQ